MKHVLMIAVLLLSFAAPALAAESGKESAYDRVMRTGTIRCGYWIFPPLIIKDPNTGAMSGAYVDYIEAMGKALDLKIEWAGEINLSTYLQDLNQGKFDAECSTGWPNALRGKQVEYTAPVGYLPIYVYAAADRTDFDGHPERINDPKVRFSGHDGGTNSLVQQKFFPHSELVGIPGDAPFTEPLNMIKFRKADVTVVTTFEGDGFIAQNPGSVRRVVSNPVRIIPLNMSVGAYEFRLLNMLNTATNELLYDGTIESLYKKYDIGNDVVLRVAKPYGVPQP